MAFWLFSYTRTVLLSALVFSVGLVCTLLLTRLYFQLGLALPENHRRSTTSASPGSC